MSTPRLRRTNADLEKRKEGAAAAGNRHVDLVYAQPSRLTKIIGISLIVVSLSACQHPAKEPVTLTFLDPEWSHDLTERNVLPDERLQEFMRQTGIRVKHLPAPETALDQLGMALELLHERDPPVRMCLASM